MSEARDFREAFPICQNTAYFQWAYRGALPTLSLMRLSEIHAAHALGGASERPRWFAEYERVAGMLCSMLNADTRLITYTPNTSFAMGMIANGLEWQEGDEILIPAGEFPANVYPWMALESFGVTTRVVEADREGRVKAEALLAAIRPETKLVAASHVSFHNGYRMDIHALAKGCRDAGVWSVIDAAQSIGWAAIDIKAIGADVVTGVGRKFLCALDGVGFMFLSEKMNQTLKVANPGPFSVKHQSDYLNHHLDFRDEAARLTGGGIASPQIFALGTSLELFEAVGGFEAIEREVDHHASYLRSELQSAGVNWVGSEWLESESSAIIRIPTQQTLRGEEFEAAGVSVSVREGGLRVSLHAMNNKEDVDRLVKVLSETAI